jgi:very-short-patch-repair endonuclease
VRNDFPAQVAICSSPRYGLATTPSLRAGRLSYDAIGLRVRRGALVQRYPHEVDFHWPAWRLVVEVDGEHTRPRDVRNEPARDRVLKAAGWTVVRRTGAAVEYLASSDERATPDRLLGARRP